MGMQRVRRRSGRRGAAATEMVLLATPLILLSVVLVDLGRMFYYSAAIENCARNGALYASDPFAATYSSYGSVQQAALADAGGISPVPTVASTGGNDAAGNPYVAVTVTYPFSMLSSYPGFFSPTNIARTVRMRVTPTTPN